MATGSRTHKPTPQHTQQCGQPRASAGAAGEGARGQARGRAGEGASCRRVANGCGHSASPGRKSRRGSHGPKGQKQFARVDAGRSLGGEVVVSRRWPSAPTTYLKPRSFPRLPTLVFLPTAGTSFCTVVELVGALLYVDCAVEPVGALLLRLPLVPHSQPLCTPGGAIQL